MHRLGSFCFGIMGQRASYEYEYCCTRYSIGISNRGQIGPGTKHTRNTRQIEVMLDWTVEI